MGSLVFFRLTLNDHRLAFVLLVWSTKLVFDGLTDGFGSLLGFWLSFRFVFREPDLDLPESASFFEPVFDSILLDCNVFSPPSTVPSFDFTVLVFLSVVLFVMMWDNTHNSENGRACGRPTDSSNKVIQLEMISRFFR